MTKKRDLSVNDLMELMVHMRTAHTAEMVMLVKALEEAGALTSSAYEAKIRTVASIMETNGPPEVSALLEDFADMLSRNEMTKQ